MNSHMDQYRYEWREGYEAYQNWEQYGGDRPNNPYEYDTLEYDWWDKGFYQAGEDS